MTLAAPTPLQLVHEDDGLRQAIFAGDQARMHQLQADYIAAFTAAAAAAAASVSPDP